jgi:hypothetical protein
MIYQKVSFNYPPFLKGGRGDYKTFHPRENVDLDTFAEVSLFQSLFFSVILNKFKRLKLLKIRDSSLYMKIAISSQLFSFQQRPWIGVGDANVGWAPPTIIYFKKTQAGCSKFSSFVVTLRS